MRMRRRRKDRAGALPLALLLILAALFCGLAPASADEAAGGDGVAGAGDGGESGADGGVYSIACNLPPAVVKNVSLSAEVPKGLVYKSESLSISGAADLASALVTSSGPADGSGSLALAIFFPEVNNSLDLDLLIQFVAVVADIPENADGAVLADLPVRLSFDDGLWAESSFSGSIPGVCVVEPALGVNKRVVGPSADGKGLVYEVAVFHTSSSTSAAYDVLLADLLPAGWSVSGFVTVVGPAWKSAVVSTGPTVSFDCVDLAWTAANPVVVRYEAASFASDESGSGSASSSSSSSSSSSGSASAGGTLAWTSAAGPVAEERSYLLEYALEPYASLELSIEADVSGVTVGDLVTYVYRLRNSGFANLTDLAVVDAALGPIPLDKTALAPGEAALGTAERTVVSEDFPGPLVANATASGIAEGGGEVAATASLALSFFENHLSIVKRADKKSAERGELVNYTITIANGAVDSPVSPTDLVVEDVFSRPVEIVSASPQPDCDGKWRYSELPAGQNRQIRITIRVPDEQDFAFDSAQAVTGTGFVNVRNEYSTAYEPFPLRNCASVTYRNGTTSEVSRLTSCASVAVRGGAGTSLSTKEHGSGTYASGEVVAVRTENRSISLEKDLSAAAGETTLGLYRGRTVTYSSPWSSSAVGRNRVTGASITEAYRRSSSIDRESRLLLDKNESAISFEAEFDGTATFGFVRMPDNSSFRATPLYEAREDYSGSFRVVERVDEYGSGVKSERAASGTGIVAVDKRVGETQRSFEHGSGTYEVDELIETYTSYIAKDISVVYEPLGPGSSLWKEGIASQKPGISLLSEEYSQIAELEKDSVARGLNELETTAAFSGTARYRVLYSNRTRDPGANASAAPCAAGGACGPCAPCSDSCANATADASCDAKASRHRPEIDIDEIYSGDYRVERRVMISGASKYDHPHLNVTKALVGIKSEELDWDYGEAHLPGEVKTRRVADYTIRIENDGSRALAPILVRDLFPPGATFIDSSLRPTASAAGSANWTLTHLAIGGVAEISLRLDVTRFAGEEMTNRVEVCGGYGDNWVCAGNYTSLQRRWLACCPQDEITVVKTARIDPENPLVVLYTVVVENTAAATRAATVTDYFPQGMALLASSLPVASQEDGVVVWVLPSMAPGEKVTIEFSALAPGLGRYTNVVEVEASSVDGPGVEPLHVASVVQVGSPEECGPAGCGIWQPPAWDFQRIGYVPDPLGCEIFAGEEGLPEV